MTDYLPRPITDSPQNSQHRDGFIPKHFPAPLLEALNMLKTRGISVDLCSRTSVLDNRFYECNIVCEHDQIISPDDIPDTCECVYVYKKSDRWIVSHTDPIYEKFTPLIFVKRNNRTSLDAMYVIDKGDTIESELVYYNLTKDILDKLEELDLLPRFDLHYPWGDARSCAHKLALAINSLNRKRINKSYQYLDYCLDHFHDGFISRSVPELKAWIVSKIIEVSIMKNKPIEINKNT